MFPPSDGGTAYRADGILTRLTSRSPLHLAEGHRYPWLQALGVRCLSGFRTLPKAALVFISFGIYKVSFYHKVFWLIYRKGRW